MRSLRESNSLSLTHTHTHTLSHPLFLYLSLSLSLSLLLSLSLSYAAKGREALDVACSCRPTEWFSALLFASRLVECDQREKAEIIFADVIESQLSPPVG